PAKTSPGLERVAARGLKPCRDNPVNRYRCSFRLSKICVCVNLRLRNGHIFALSGYELRSEHLLCPSGANQVVEALAPPFASKLGPPFIEYLIQRYAGYRLHIGPLTYQTEGHVATLSFPYVRLSIQ